jgi:hypothetical protein
MPSLQSLQLSLPLQNRFFFKAYNCAASAFLPPDFFVPFFFIVALLPLGQVSAGEGQVR